MTTRLIPAVETYFAALDRVRASGGAKGERAHCTALGNLLTAVGAPLKPKVFCVPELADQGAEHPDFGLYAAYERIKSVFPLGLPFASTAVNAEWFEWPALPDLFPVSFPGVKTSRDGFLVDVDLVRLNARVAEYFDEALSQEEIARRYPSVMKTTVRFDTRTVRETLLARGGPNETGFMRFAYRPFDSRWIYWETETKLLDEKRADYRPHVFAENLWLEAREREAKEDFSRGTFVRHLADNFGNGLSNFFPAWLRNDGSIENNTIDTRRPNLSNAHNAISTASTPTSQTCSTTASPCCTIQVTAPPTPGRYAWNGHASRCLAGPMVRTQWRSPSPNRRPAAANSPNC